MKYTIEIIRTSNVGDQSLFIAREEGSADILANVSVIMPTDLALQLKNAYDQMKASGKI